MQNIYANFDGLDMAFYGKISDDTLDALAQAKAQAQELRGDAAAVINGLPVMVGETGARGGYAYTVKTGIDGAVLFIARESKPAGSWLIKASFNSAAFAQHGGLTVNRDRLSKWLGQLGYIPETDKKSGLNHSITRVDFCMDFLAPMDWELDVSAISFKGGKTDYMDGLEAHWRGRRATGVRIGKMPNRQVTIYDKTADIAAKGKDYWWQVWGLEKAQTKADKNRVWRVELRAGKKFLRDTWDVRTFEDLENCVGDMFADTLDKIRYVTLSDSNITRCPDAPLWTLVRNVVAKGLEGLFSGLCPGTVKKTTRLRFEATMTTLIKGVALTYASVTVGRDNLADIKRHILKTIDGVIYDIMADPDDALKHAAKARDRYQMLGVAEWQKQRVQAVPDWLTV